MMQLHGVLAPVVTPFATSGDVDLEAFAANITSHVTAGACGIVITGSTGEAAMLDDSERNALTQCARRAAGPDVTLLVGTGSESTRATIARSHAAAEHGADGVLVVAPHYYGDQMSDDALRIHYERIADDSRVPVLLYSIPKYMHFALSPELVALLSRHQNIVGMKDSSGDRRLFGEYLTSQSESFRVLTGNGGFFHEALHMGAYGAILAVSLFAPSLTFDVWNAFQRDESVKAQRAHDALFPLASKVVGGMGVPGIKAALDRVGLVGGVPRPPLSTLASSHALVLDGLLRAAELAPAA